MYLVHRAENVITSKKQASTKYCEGATRVVNMTHCIVKTETYTGRMSKEADGQRAHNKSVTVT